jgi:hypothetical protein
VWFIADQRNTTTFVELVAIVPNIGLIGTAIGGGVGSEVSSEGGGTSFNSDEVHHLSYIADHGSNWAWGWIACTVLVFAVGAVWTVYRSGSARVATRNLLSWVVLCAIALPVFAHFAGGHLHLEGSSFLPKHQQLDVFEGVVGWQVILLGALGSFATAVIAATVLRQRQSRAAATAWAPPPPGQEWQRAGPAVPPPSAPPPTDHVSFGHGGQPPTPERGYGPSGQPEQQPPPSPPPAPPS